MRFGRQNYSVVVHLTSYFSLCIHFYFLGRQLVAEDKVNRQPGTDISGQVSEQTDRQGHIMISYSWSDKEKVIRIRNELEKQGLKVTTQRARHRNGVILISCDVIA